MFPQVEVGYASGDANPFDDQANGFTMNRDYKVGLVLFDEVMLFQTQNAARRLSDPALLGAPPPGLDLLPTEGAITNALYLKPTLRWKPGFLGGRLRRGTGSVEDQRGSDCAVRTVRATRGATGRRVGYEPGAGGEFFGAEHR